MQSPVQPAWRVALLAGGDSEEREISLQSGEAVEAALRSRGHFVLHLDPAIVDLAGVDWRQFDVAFLVLHGRFGEDGQVQQILDDCGVPYTGSSAAASRLAFSKSAAKERFLQAGLPTPEYVLLHYADDFDRTRRQAETLGYPIAIKPDGQGSSIGVTILRSPHELAPALRRAFQFDSCAVMERAIPGTEWTVGLLDDRVLPAIEIETAREFFDFEAKYQAEDTRYRFVYTLPMSVVHEVERIASEACRAIGTRGIARVDLRVDTTGQPWLLEVNTIPGMTSHSLVPKAAARVGMEFAELCERAIESCLPQSPRAPHFATPTVMSKKPSVGGRA